MLPFLLNQHPDASSKDGRNYRACLSARANEPCCAKGYGMVAGLTDDTLDITEHYRKMAMIWKSVECFFYGREKAGERVGNELKKQ